MIHKIFFLLGIAFFSFMTNAVAQHKLPELPYSFNALEPYIDAQTMEIHYTKHHQGYVTNLNNALNEDQKKLSINQLLSTVSKLSPAIRNNAGGHYNHSLFWTILANTKNTQPSAQLMKAIETQFLSMDSLKSTLNKAASTRFGSGWAWLVVTSERNLVVCSTPNQDNPLMDIAEVKGTPILGIDVWEHAYYLKYQNKRADYLSAIWNIINWEEVSSRYGEAFQ
jgi:Fe-Mn family superoxide dismutase